MKRICFLLQVKRDRLAEYEARHKTVWPEMLEALRQTGWHNYSLLAHETAAESVAPAKERLAYRPDWE